MGWRRSRLRMCKMPERRGVMNPNRLLLAVVLACALCFLAGASVRQPVSCRSWFEAAKPAPSRPIATYTEVIDSLGVAPLNYGGRDYLIKTSLTSAPDGTVYHVTVQAVRIKEADNARR